MKRITFLITMLVCTFCKAQTISTLPRMTIPVLRHDGSTTSYIIYQTDSGIVINRNGVVEKFDHSFFTDHTNNNYDTVKIEMLISDTSHKVGNISGYDVRSVEYRQVDVSHDPNIIMPNGGITAIGWMPQYENKAFYTHIEYLDENKQPLRKDIIVWQTK